MRPLPEYSEREIERIQERFANFVLRTSAKADNQSSEDLLSTTVSGAKSVDKSSGEEKTSGGSGEGGGEGSGNKASGEGGSGGGEYGGGRRMTRIEAAEARRRSREAISQQVSNRGLLALLTGTGSAAQGEAVSSLLDVGSKGGSGSGKDLDEVLSSVDGLKTQGGSGLGEGGGGGTVRGRRSGRKTNIDDLVSDLESAGSRKLTRKGTIVVESVSDVAGKGKKSVYRSPEAIQQVLISHNSALQYCYERELKRSPNLKGKITVRITVAPDGSVKNAEIVSSTLNNKRVERCILARIRLWKDFPPIDPDEGDVVFRQVYVFGT